MADAPRDVAPPVQADECARTARPAADAGSVPLALALNVVAGWTDGVGASWIAGVFVSFMSGNTTSTGIALGTGDRDGLLHAGLTIPLFVVGAVLGALLIERSRALALVLVAVVLVGFQLWSLGHGPVGARTAGLEELVPLVLLVIPMGVLNTTVRRVGSVSISLGFVTGTLVGLGEAIATLLTRPSRAAAADAALLAGSWAVFLLGAAGGAAAVALAPTWSVVPPVVVLTAVLLTGAARVRRSRRRIPT